MIRLDATVNDKPAVLMLDAVSNVSFVDMPIAGLAQFKAEKIRRLGMSGCVAAHPRLFDASEQRMCVADLSNLSKQLKEKVHGLVGEDVLREFSAIKIDYKHHVLELE